MKLLFLFVIFNFLFSLLFLVCQNNCSGHGHCDMHTKECICEAFWMQNPVRVYVIGDGSYNCGTFNDRPYRSISSTLFHYHFYIMFCYFPEWSVLYVIIIAFILVIVFGILVWMLYCCCERYASVLHFSLCFWTFVRRPFEIMPKNL